MKMNLFCASIHTRFAFVCLAWFGLFGKANTHTALTHILYLYMLVMALFDVGACANEHTVKIAT